MLALCIQIARKLRHVYSLDIPYLQLLEGKLNCQLVKKTTFTPEGEGGSGR